MSSQTALTLIKGALRRINSYQSGEQIDAPDANDSLECLNDMLDLWSTSEQYVFGSVENVVDFVPGQYVYTIGPGGDFSTDKVTGDPITRPLRITNAFTRITTQVSGLDYPIEIVDQTRYVSIGFKAISAPWPIMLWYNNTMPLGTLSFYQNPSQGGELHLYTDTILSDLTLNQKFVLPQGYSLAIKLNLAKHLCLEFGFALNPNLEKLALESLAMIKALNANPVPVSQYDAALIGGSRYDASWIYHGGFN